MKVIIAVVAIDDCFDISSIVVTVCLMILKIPVIQINLFNNKISPHDSSRVSCQQVTTIHVLGSKNDHNKYLFVVKRRR